VTTTAVVDAMGSVVLVVATRGPALLGATVVPTAALGEAPFGSEPCAEQAATDSAKTSRIMFEKRIRELYDAPSDSQIV
jgi:hypothetical protein